MLDGEEANRVAAAAQAFVEGPVSEDCAELGLEDESAEKAIDADDDATAQSVGGKLHENGYPEPVLLAGGIDGWKERGLPIESSTQEQPVPGEENAGIHLI